MANINLEFLDSYKHLDKLCREMYGTNGGVSAYIEDMENKNSPYNDVDWKTTYAMLKKLRWIRNRLVHDSDISIEDDFCSEEQVTWLNMFYERIMATDDPLARYRREVEERCSVAPAKPKTESKQSNNTVYGQHEERYGGGLKLAAFLIIAAVIMLIYFMIKPI